MEMHIGCKYGGVSMMDDRRVHDEVFIQSIDRRERITRYLVSNLGIDETSARD